MSYKDTKSFHKDFGDGGRKARETIKRIAEHREQKFARNAETDANDNAVIAQMECHDCRYVGDEKEDFAPPVDAQEGVTHQCPVCGCTACKFMTEEDMF